MAEFNDKLASLVSSRNERRHCPRSGEDVMPDRKPRVFTGLYVAIAAKGEAKAIDHLLEGIVSYIYTTAAERAPLAAHDRRRTTQQLNRKRP